MAFLTAAYAAESEKRAAPGTIAAGARDRVRLKQLEHDERDCLVMTWNWGATVAQTEPNKHFQGFFGNRGARALAKERPTLRFERVIFDYLRFPCEYMLKAYAPALRAMVVLFDKGLVTAQTVLLLPNCADLLEGFRTEFGARIASLTPIAAADHPLYAATDKVADKVLPDRAKHANELGNFDADFPFVRLMLCSLAK